MAEKEEDKKGGIFGGRSSLKEDLKDISGDKRSTFADTWLGDLLGFDGKVGVQGPGLKESWQGARRGNPDLDPSDDDDLETLVTKATEVFQIGPSTRGGPRRYNDTPDGGPRRGRVTSDNTLDMISESGSGMDKFKDIGLPKPKITSESPEQPPESRLMKNSEFGMGVADVDTGVNAGKPTGLMGRPTKDEVTVIEQTGKTAIYGNIMQVLGSKSEAYKNLDTVLLEPDRFKRYTRLTKLIKDVQAAPPSSAKTNALDELYKMRDATR